MMNTPQLARLGLFDSRAPRYTSYPTAPHFADGVNGETFGNWIESIPENSQVSLYIHIPFCRRLCWFCACRTQGTSSGAPVLAYVETLLAEIAKLKAHLPPGVTMSRLHWGGGTPTLLAPDLIERLAAAIFDAVPLGDGAEFSVEIDPNEFDADRMAALKRAGLTRASVGVQDFNDRIQECIGRIQSYALTRDVIDQIRTAGVESLNVDILFGLPHQTEARISDSVQKVLSLSPDRVALYGYAHVPWMSRRQQLIPSEALPGPESRLALAERARDLFLWDGYEAIGIDHFARPEDGLAVSARSGGLRRNFQGYTDDQAEVLIGLGASSISRFPQGYAQNASGTADYSRAIQAGSFATTRGHAFVGEDRLRARIIEALMCDFEVSRAELMDRFAVARDRLDSLFSKAMTTFPGVVSDDGARLRILPEARQLARLIARTFDAYDTAKAQHSAAI